MGVRFLSKTQIIRLVIQSVFLIISLAILSMVIITGKKAIHAACPFAIVCFGLNPGQLFRLTFQLFASGVVLGLLVLISSMFWGRKFCSYICPLGTIQQGLFHLRSPKYRLTKKVPLYIERKVGVTRYVILAATIILAGSAMAYYYIRFCPIYGLSRLPSIAVGSLIVIGVSLNGAFFTERFWCRFLCPYAALLNIFQALGKFFGIKRTLVRRNLERCTDCRACSLYCPMNINLLESEYVKDPNCIGCGICAAKCPRPGTIDEHRETL